MYNDDYRKERELREKQIRKRIIGGVTSGLVVLTVAIAVAKCTVRINPGYSGIQYSMSGGVKEEVLGQGWHTHSPFIKVIQYPTARQQGYLSADEKEGSEDNDSFNVPTSDGKTVNVDLEYAYMFDAEKLSTTYTEFKGKSADQIESEFIRAKLKSWAGEVTAKYSVIDIYGDKRSEINGEVFNALKTKFADYGIIIDSVSFTRIEPDEQTKKAIQEKINKQQELETAKLDAQKAEIEAEKKRTQAQAKADAKIIEAEAEAKANDLLQESISENLIKMKEAEARLKHGWVEIQGANSVIVDKKDN